MKKRVPGYSLLASLRVLEPQLPASLKVLLVPVTSIDEESFVLASTRVFSKRDTTLAGTHDRHSYNVKRQKNDWAGWSLALG